LKVEAKLENLAEIANFISRSMSRLGLTVDVFKVQTAVDEACTNIIKYAYTDGKGIITIKCEILDQDFVITIRDWGKPFDPTLVAPPDLETNLDDRKIGGLGIYLMRKLMDDVSYSFNPKEGNKLVMKKRLASKNVQR
jgi:serine/threonine-protein kinase RsbW